MPVRPQTRTWPPDEDLTWFQQLDPLKLIAMVSIVLSGVVVALSIVLFGLNHALDARDRAVQNLEQRTNIQQAEIDSLRTQMETLRATHS